MNPNKILTYFIACVWLVNGLICKVLNLVPRHQQIVSEILGAEHARLFATIIGISEIVMTLWILSGIKPRINAVAQIIVVAVMNVVEFILVPHLLLWGRANAIFAAVFIFLIYYNEFALRKKLS